LRPLYWEGKFKSRGFTLTRLYSQGTAVVSNAISELSSSVKDKVKGVVFFGYTKNLQNLGAIPKFPRNKLEVYCEIGDLVCTGSLIITASHLTYVDEAATVAPAFLARKIG